MGGVSPHCAAENNTPSPLAPLPHPRFVDLATTIAGFKSIVAGEYDQLPENAFYMQGGIADVVENAVALARSTDTSVKQTGASKRDVDYCVEYNGFMKELEAGKKTEAFSQAALVAKIRAQLGTAAVDAEMDAFYSSRKKTQKA